MTEIDTAQPPNPRLIQLDGLTIDLDDYCIRYADGTESQLSGQEQMLLNTLIEAGGQVVTMEQLGRKVWGWERAYSAGAIWNCAYRLRQKLRDDPSHPRYIQTVRRIGYRFRLPRTTGARGRPSAAARPDAPRPEEQSDARSDD